MNFCSWNVRGLNKSAHQRELINFIAINHISLICCIETKVKHLNASSINVLIEIGDEPLTMSTIDTVEFGLLGIQPFGKSLCIVNFLNM